MLFVLEDEIDPQRFSIDRLAFSAWTWPSWLVRQEPSWVAL
jgi:hypothetical protein